MKIRLRRESLLLYRRSWVYGHLDILLRRILYDSVSATSVLLTNTHTECVVIERSIITSPALGKICGLEDIATRMCSLVGTIGVQVLFRFILRTLHETLS